MITAEVIPIIGKKNEAALALQREGFKILHIGQSVTIAGDKDLFEKTLQIKLTKTSKKILRDLPEPAVTEYYQTKDQPSIPEKLKSLIKEIYFQEPPEFFI
ncbi:MAG: hypothetical protein NWE89_06400 [Candidatus Bathyarchaeota archaeon]|nr:hypothetical protein [Candidatus Bathyarchaeota archaeon]